MTWSTELRRPRHNLSRRIRRARVGVNLPDRRTASAGGHTPSPACQRYCQEISVPPAEEELSLDVLVDA